MDPLGRDATTFFSLKTLRHSAVFFQAETNWNKQVEVIHDPESLSVGRLWDSWYQFSQYKMRRTFPKKNGKLYFKFHKFQRTTNESLVLLMFSRTIAHLWIFGVQFCLIFSFQGVSSKRIIHLKWSSNNPTTYRSSFSPKILILFVCPLVPVPYTSNHMKTSPTSLPQAPRRVPAQLWQWPHDGSPEWFRGWFRRRSEVEHVKISI